jgi:CHRD domain
MRRLAIFAFALAFAAPACDDDSPTGPSNTGPIVFRAELRASNEVPPISNAESGGQGTATITFSVPRDSSGNITGGGTWNVQAVVSGLTNDSVFRAAHIHNGVAGQNANVFVDTRLTAANPINIGTGGTVNFEGVDITQAQAQAVVANPAGHYFNMHTILNPGGVIRGQMERVQ